MVDKKNWLTSEPIVNSVWLILEKAIRALVGLSLGVVVARHFGPQKYGELNLVLSFVAVFSVVGAFGLDAIVARELVRRPDESRYILASASLIRLFGALLLILLANGSAYIYRPQTSELRWGVFIISLSALFQTGSLVDVWFQVNLQSCYPVLVRTVVFIFGATLRWHLAVTNAPLTSFSLVIFAELSLTAIALVVMYQLRNGDLLRWRFLSGEVKGLFRQGVPVVLSSFAVACYSRIDMLMVGYFKGSTEVGYYGGASTVSEAFYMIPVALMASFAPLLTSAKMHDEGKYIINLSKCINFISRGGVFIAFGVSVLAGFIINLLFGSDYHQAELMLAIHVWSTLFVFISVASEPWFINNGFQRLFIAKYIVAALCNIGLNLFLIPLYGGVGASISTVISYSVSAYWSNWLIIKARPLFYLQTDALFFGIIKRNK